MEAKKLISLRVNGLQHDHYRIEVEAVPRPRGLKAIKGEKMESAVVEEAAPEVVLGVDSPGRRPPVG